MNAAAVADTPSVTNATTTVNQQTTSGLIVSPNAVDGASATHYRITGISGGTLYQNDSTTQINNGDFITAAQGAAGLKFTPALNSPADGSFDVQAATGAGQLGGSVVTATIDVINTTPTTSGIATVDVDEDAANFLVDLWAAFADAEEADTLLTYTVEGNTNPGLFSSTAVDAPNGDLALDFAANAFGTADITVRATDPAGAWVETTVTVNVAAVADTPSVTDALTKENTQSTSGLVITPNPADGAEVTHYQITNIVGGTLYQNDSTTQINSGDFITAAEGAAGLKFTPTLDSLDDGSFGVQAATGATVGDLGGGVATAEIEVISGPVPGDFDDDGDADADDIDALWRIVHGSAPDPHGNDDADLNGDSAIDEGDMDYLIGNILGTVYGDADLDGDVDGADFDAWRIRDSEGAPIGWATGDFDGDGDVDGADFDLWRLRPAAFSGGESLAGGGEESATAPPAASSSVEAAPRAAVQVESTVVGSTQSVAVRRSHAERGNEGQRGNEGRGVESVDRMVNTAVQSTTMYRSRHSRRGAGKFEAVDALFAAWQ